MSRSPRFTPVPLGAAPQTIAREAEARVRQFLRDIGETSSLPSGGERITENYQLLVRRIRGHANQPSCVYAHNGNADVWLGDCSAVCDVGAQGVYVLRIFYRKEERVWYRYEFVLCLQGRGTKWVNATDFYRDYARSSVSEVPSLDDPRRVVSSAQSVFAEFQSGRRRLRPEGARLTARGVISQVESLTGMATLGSTRVDTVADGGYMAVVFTSTGGRNLRIFQRNGDVWRYETLRLEITPSRPNPQRRGRGVASAGTRYLWK